MREHQLLGEEPVISIHALREEGDSRRCRCCRSRPISIHALREEGDFLVGRCSTDLHRISIHALREEGDRGRRVQPCGRVDFYPRPPRGGRPQFSTLLSRTLGLFLSTPSARRATGTGQGGMIMAHNFYPRPPRGGRPSAAAGATVQKGISIHALREEGDASSGTIPCLPRYFYPRPPRGGRPGKPDRRVCKPELISIHALREEGDPNARISEFTSWISIHALREEGDHRRPTTFRGRNGISIHALREEGDAKS